MISAGDFRNGITLEIDGQVVQIMEFQHVKPGKGAAFVRTKLKNVINGGVVELSLIHILVIIVQLIQEVAMRMSRKSDKRIR